MKTNQRPLAWLVRCRKLWPTSWRKAVPPFSYVLWTRGRFSSMYKTEDGVKFIHFLGYHARAFMPVPTYFTSCPKRKSHKITILSQEERFVFHAPRWSGMQDCRSTDPAGSKYYCRILNFHHQFRIRPWPVIILILSVLKNQLIYSKNIPFSSCL